MLQLWTVNVSPAFYGWADVNGTFQGVWYCRGQPYVVPYFCPFNEIECLQPVTLAQLPYTLFDEGTIPPYNPGCADFPPTITITPA
jgi:hypothetical protein